MGYDTNKVSHIFADKHQMNRLVKEFGVPEAAHKDGEYVYDPGLSLTLRRDVEHANQTIIWQAAAR